MYDQCAHRNVSSTSRVGGGGMSRWQDGSLPATLLVLVYDYVTDQCHDLLTLERVCVAWYMAPKHMRTFDIGQWLPRYPSSISSSAP